MKTTMKMMLAAAGLSLAAAAMANPDDGYAPRRGMGGPGGGYGPMGGPCGEQGQMGGPRGEHGPMGGPGMEGRGPSGAGFESRLEMLKAELKLTDAQQPAWAAYEKAFKAHFESMRTTREQRPEAQSGDPMEARIAFMEKQLASMKTVSAARKELYKKLTAEQKALMDRPMQPMGGGPRTGGQGRPDGR